MPWVNQPPFIPPLNSYWSNGLQICSMPGISGRFLSAIPSSIEPTSNDLTVYLKSFVGSRFGPATAMTAPAANAPSFYYASDMKAFDGSSNYTYMFVGSQPSTTADITRKTGFCIGDESGGSFMQSQLCMNCDKGAAYSSGKAAFFEYNSGFNVACESTAGAVDGQVHVYIGRRQGSIPTIWRDGINVTAAGATTGATTTATWTDRWGFGGTTFRMVDKSILGVAWNRALSDADIARLGANPWQIFMDADDEVYFGVSGAAGTLLKANYTALTDLSALNTTAKASISAANGLTTGS